MIIRSLELETVCGITSTLPENTLPEIAFAGKSNVGKSSLINRMSKQSKANVEDRPGVTRENRWFTIGKGFELLDTPGVLWPKFEDQRVGERLAFTGAINDDILDSETLACKLIDYLRKLYPNALAERYKVTYDENTKSEEVLNQIAVNRGFKLKGNELDLKRAADILIDEFRAAKLGRMTLESVENILED